VNQPKKPYQNLASSIQNNRQVIRFLIIFIFNIILFFTIFYLFEDSFDFLKKWTADITAVIANFFGLEVTAQGTLLILKTTTFEIIQECTGLFAIMIYLSCVLAYPTTIVKKGEGIILGVPLIVLLNLGRMVFLVYIGDHHQDLFEYIHSYLWQGTFIIVVILLWFIWIEKIAKK
jgi:archaeosortase B (VPXXXP-CTERM-specific)